MESLREAIKTFSAVILFITGAFSAFSQNIEFKLENFPSREFFFNQAIENILKGDELYFDEDPLYKKALPFYEKANEFNPNNAELNFKIGRCYLGSHYKFKAQEYFEKAIKLHPAVDPRINYWYGFSLHINGLWDKALESYNKHAQLQLSNEDRKNTTKRIVECNYGKEYTARPMTVKIESAGTGLNTEYPEYTPLITADEAFLYFTSRRKDTFGGDTDPKTEDFYEDIYVSEKINNSWSTAQNLGAPVNTRIHDGGAGLSPDGHTMFVFRGDVNKGDIFISNLTAGAWSKPVDPGKNINTKFHESAACLSPDGNTLYFVSDKPGGNGERDIYKSKWDNTAHHWMPAQNLGPAINSAYDEEGVFMQADGRTLYFSSKGHTSMGGYDVMYSTLENGQWSKPVNMGSPINTPDDDVFFVVAANGKHAYYSSFKKEGKGEKDIYMITFEDSQKPESKMTIVKGVIRNAITKEPLAAKIELIDLNNSEHIGEFTSDSKTGRYLVSLPSGKNYGAIAYSKDFLFESEHFEISQDAAFKEVTMDIEMKPMNEGFNMVLTNIFFDTDKFELKSESQDVLGRLEALLKEKPTLQIEISGHTDNEGSAEYNQQLSESRAKSVVDYLVSKGVDPKRMSYTGFGETKPFAPNTTLEGRKKNRRIEFKITSVQ